MVVWLHCELIAGILAFIARWLVTDTGNGLLSEAAGQGPG